MPMRASKALEAVKHLTNVSGYVSGTPAPPEAGELCIYTDLVEADHHRGVEISSKLETIFNRAREVNYGGPVDAIIYFHSPLDAAKDNILVTAVATEIVEGNVGIGIHSDVRTAGPPSILIDSTFKRMMEWLGETGQMAAGPPLPP